MKTHKHNGGFALIEVLLAVVILAIGLLAGSKMQILGLNYTQGALTRSQASMAANDIIDRMRINKQGVIDGNYNGADTDAPPIDPGCITVGCTPTQLADHDIREWSRFFGQSVDANTARLLPDGANGTIVGPDANGNVTISISWDDRVQTKATRANNSHEARSLVINVTI